jgi:hypothetical protein
MGNAGLSRGLLLAVAVQIVAETVTHLHLGLYCLHFHHSFYVQVFKYILDTVCYTFMYLHGFIY